MKQLLKQMSVYGIGGALCKAIQILLLPLYTRVLAPSDYGLLELTNMVGFFASILYGFMISSGYIRYYFEGKNDPDRNNYFGTAFWFTFIISSATLLGILFEAENLSILIFKVHQGAIYIKLIGIAFAINAHKQLFYNLLMVKERAQAYMLINVFSLIVTLLITIWFVAFLKLGVIGVLQAQVIGFSLELIMLSVLLLRPTVFQFTSRAAWQMLSYSLPLIPVQLAAFVLNLSDRLFIQNYRNLDDVGIYSLGYRFASIIPLFAVYPLRGFTPYLYTLIGTPAQCKKTLSNFLRLYLAGILIVALFMALFSKEVIAIMSHSTYRSAWKVVFPLCLSFVFYGLANVVSYTVEIAKKTWLSGIFWVIAAGISISLNFFLVPRFGMLGATASSAISYLVILICYFIASASVYPTPFHYLKYIAIIVFCSIIYVISIIPHFNLIGSVFFKISVLIASCGLLIISGYFSKEELSKGKSIIVNLFCKAKFFCTLY
jgi:O-antigen/teichoic acid export membrane protein